jgi:hypothetical protein
LAPEPRRYGYRADDRRRWTVYQLGAATILAALFSWLPAALEVVPQFSRPESLEIPAWAWLLLLTGGFQVAFAVYAMQVPDWGTVWVLSVFGLGLSAAYAMALGIALLADPGNEFVEMLGLSMRIHGFHIRGWCLILLSLSILLAYASGRIATRWHRAYQAVAAGGPRRESFQADGSTKRAGRWN